MVRLTLLGLALILAHWTAPSAHAQAVNDWTIGDLLRRCQSTAASYQRRLNIDESLDALTCDAYVLGVKHGYEDARGELGLGPSFCFGRQVTRGQLSATFVEWAARNPERWREPASLGVQEALRIAFPCGE